MHDQPSQPSNLRHWTPLLAWHVRRSLEDFVSNNFLCSSKWSISLGCPSFSFDPASRHSSGCLVHGFTEALAGLLDSWPGCEKAHLNAYTVHELHVALRGSTELLSAVSFYWRMHKAIVFSSEIRQLIEVVRHFYWIRDLPLAPRLLCLAASMS